MNEITVNGINQKIPSRGPDGQHSRVVKHEPLDGGHKLGLDRGQVGPDLDPAGPVQVEDQDGGPVRDCKGSRVEGGEEVGVFHQPILLSGADVSEIVAGDGAELRRVVPP